MIQFTRILIDSYLYVIIKLVLATYCNQTFATKNMLKLVLANWKPCKIKLIINRDTFASENCAVNCR